MKSSRPTSIANNLIGRTWRYVSQRLRASYQRNRYVIIPTLLTPIGMTMASVSGPVQQGPKEPGTQYLKGRVLSSRGLYPKAIAALAETARQYNAEFTLVDYEGQKADLTETERVTQLAIPQGRKFTIYAKGPEAQAAISRLADVLSEELRVAEVRRIAADQEVKLTGQPITDNVIIGRVLPIKEFFEINQFPLIDIAKVAAEQGKTVDEILTRRMDMVVDAFRVMEEDLSNDNSEIAQMLGGLLMSLKTRILEAMESETICGRAAAERTLAEMQKLKESPDEKFSSLYWDIHNLCVKMLAIKHSKVIDIRREIDRMARNSVILVADDISPSDVGLVNDPRVGAVVREKGSIKDHLAIRLADRERAGLVGVKTALPNVRMGSRAIVDGAKGQLIINPSRATLLSYRLRIREHRMIFRQLTALRDRPAITLDGQRIRIMGNAANADEVAELLQQQHDGIGLVRTEFFFIYDKESAARKAEPSITEQIEFYNKLIAAGQGKEMTFRTIDPDKDKSFPYFSQTVNGVLNTDKKGLALCLDRENHAPYHYAFRNQLKALLQTQGRIKIMFPLVRSEAEYETAIAVVDEVRRELAKEGKEINQQIDFGIMVEHPDVIRHLEQLAGHQRLSFFSLGTNDLTQFITRINRYSGTTSRYFDELDPRVIDAIRRTVKVAQENDLDLSLCGSMGEDWRSMLVLLGLGIRKLSLSTGMADIARKIFASITISDLELLTRNIETITTAKEARRFIEDFTREQIRTGKWPDLAEIEALLYVR